MADALSSTIFPFENVSLIQQKGMKALPVKHLKWSSSLLFDESEKKKSIISHTS